MSSVVFKLEYLSIRDDSRYISILESLVRDDIGLLNVVEAYKLISREELFAVFNKYNPGIKLSVITKFTKYNSLLISSEQAGVLLGNVNGSDIDMIINVGDIRAISSLELKLAEYTINYKYVTPEDFRLLSEKADYQYDLVALFKRIVIDCIEHGGTDLHFNTKYENKILCSEILYRIGNRLVTSELFYVPTDIIGRMLKDVLSKITNILSLDIDSASGAVTYVPDVFKDGKTDLRFTANSSVGGYHAVIRIQNKGTVSMTIEELGFPANQVGSIKFLTRNSTGLTMITGLPRTGKNTTALAMINKYLADDNGLKIVEYSSPPEVLMPYPQMDYRADASILQDFISLAKKQDVDLALINEIPSRDVAFAVQGLVNSGIGVITTTHIDRVWHISYKFYELFGDYYKNVFGQLNAVINQKMFVKQCPYCGKSKSVNAQGDFEGYYNLGLRTYKEPEGCSRCRLYEGKLQPYVEILLFTSEIKRLVQSAVTLFDIDVLIEKHMRDNKLNMETYVIRDIENGRLPINSLDYFF